MDYKLFDAELRLMDLVWQHEPINSTELAKSCQNLYGWKKPTTFNLIKKLAERGFLQNLDSRVTSLVKRPEVQKYESASVVDKAFGGSLPAFVASFLKNKPLSQEEAEQIRRMIVEHERNE